MKKSRPALFCPEILHNGFFNYIFLFLGLSLDHRQIEGDKKKESPAKVSLPGEKKKKRRWVLAWIEKERSARLKGEKDSEDFHTLTDAERGFRFPLSCDVNEVKSEEF